jgi:hypothetical protein
MKFNELLYFIILVFGMLAGVLKYKHLPKAGRILFYLIVFIFFKEISARILANKFQFNLSFYQYLSPVDYILTFAVFFTIPFLKKFRRVFFVTGLIVIAFYFLNLSLWQVPGKGIDSNFKLVRSFFLVLYSLILFYNLIAISNGGNIFKNSQFWFASGILIFYVFSIFYWGVFNYYLGNKPMVMTKALRPIFEISNYLLYFFFAISLWLHNFSNTTKRVS